jgi:hypothetical protein
MPAGSDKHLSLREAAQVIYRAQQPTPEQIERVRTHIASGELEGDSRGTSTAHVAAYLARIALLRQRDARRDAPTGEIEHVYQETLKNYFLAIVFQRRVKGASRRFQRAVLGGQIALLGLILIAALFSVRTAFPPLTPERAAVLQWLDANARKPRVNRWHPPQVGDDGQLRMRVEYHYVSESGRGIDTDRVFVIAGNEVVGEASLE